MEPATEMATILSRDRNRYKTNKPKKMEDVSGNGDTLLPNREKRTIYAGKENRTYGDEGEKKSNLSPLEKENAWFGFGVNGL